MRRTCLVSVLSVAVVLVLTPARLSSAQAQVKSPPVAGAPYVPTPTAVVDAMLSLAAVDPGDLVYDLGSGDGRIVIAAAEAFGARAVGVEIDPVLVQKATANAAAAGVSDRVRFVTGDLFTVDVSDATVVTLYLLPHMLERLRPKLLAELKPGTRIVSHVFDMGPEWPPQEEHVLGPSRIFLWKIPER